MLKYTKETVDNVLKRHLISIVLSQQTKTDVGNSKIMDQICKFNENVEKLPSKLTVARQVNSVLSLSERLVSMELQCWGNAQYSRCECLELVGESRSVNDNDLEEKALKIFEKINGPIEGNNIILDENFWKFGAMPFKVYFSERINLLFLLETRDYNFLTCVF